MVDGNQVHAHWLFHFPAYKDCEIVMMDEVKLIEKLRLIEALFSGAKTDGEKDAADRARHRILGCLKMIEAADPPIECHRVTRGSWCLATGRKRE